MVLNTIALQIDDECSREKGNIPLVATNRKIRAYDTSI